MFDMKEQKKINNKKMNAKLMEKYGNWLNRQAGFTRKTMSRNEYGKMMKAFSEAGLKRTNHTISIKHHEDEASYRKAKAQWMKQWRQVAFARHLHHSGPSVEVNLPPGEILGGQRLLHLLSELQSK